jgi:hypothetical protein
VSVAALVGLPIVIALGPSIGAHAAPVEREHYSETASYTDASCGFDIEVNATYTGTRMLKAPRGEGTPPYVFDNYEAHEVLTANGRTLIADHQGLYTNVKITHVEGTVYQYVAMEAGQPFTIRDSDGHVLYRDRGAIKTTFQFDTKGDADPANDDFIDGSFRTTAINGPHPLWVMGDLCPLYEDYFFG